MEIIDLDLPKEFFERLNSSFPLGDMQSSVIGKRSVEIVKWYLLTKDQNCTFDQYQSDADLRVTLNGITIDIEVKGTTDSDISWIKLKVSGKKSYDKLLSGMPIYRVCSIYKQNPRIYILTYKDDFEMIPEPRWSIKKVGSSGKC